MKFTKLLAATAMVGGLALAGAGTAQASGTQFVVGPHATQAECTAVADFYRANYPDIDVSNCAYGTIHIYNPGTGWWFGVWQPD